MHRAFHMGLTYLRIRQFGADKFSGLNIQYILYALFGQLRNAFFLLFWYIH